MLAGAQSGAATVTDSVLLLTVTGTIRDDFVNYWWLSELPHLSLLAATRTLGNVAIALLWTRWQIIGIGPQKNWKHLIKSANPASSSTSTSSWHGAAAGGTTLSTNNQSSGTLAPFWSLNLTPNPVHQQT